MINIRLELNESLRQSGGHIGYGIRPSERRKGYNKINLYLALQVCLEHGLQEVILDCDKSNLGSSRSMLALGGQLVNEYVDNENVLCQRYIINVRDAVERYRDLYGQERKLSYKI